ncbi:HTH-type transcriptional regulator CysB [Lentisalinibacter orientalis]|jgi:LysR family cys regulon transcriptional activator|uniref:HTH-type transcriptional regulator CysB n=1 Tax=Lentisalinibacter orientalis TaxID=2992241 RepID=UPI0038642EE1
MTLRQLRYLLAIVDNGLNITAASEKLFTSQPGVSKQIRLLEEELDLRLFERKGRSLASVTPAGREVVARARSVLQEIENIRTLALNTRHEAEGTLAIGTTHTQARYVLPGVVAEFRERYPNVTLELHQGTSEQIADMVQARQIDFAIATGGQDLFSDLVMLPCYRWDRAILVPRDHELTQLDGPLTLETLARHPLVTYVFSFSGESSLKRAFAAEGLTPDVVFTARDADVIKTYVRMGMGVGIVASMAHDCGEELVAIDAEGLFPRSTTWIGFRRDTVLRRYMSHFMQLFAPHLSDSLVSRCLAAGDQSEVDRIFADIELPLRGGCAG